MKTLTIVLGLAGALCACSRGDTLEIPKGSEVTVQKHDGAQVTGRLIEAQPKAIVLEAPDGAKVQVSRADIDSVKAAAPAPPPPRDPPPAPVERAPAFREITVPSGTVLPVSLQTAVGSDTSHVEDPVRATLRRGVTIDGVEVLPAGSVVLGQVTTAERPGKVSGRGRIGVRFTRIDLPGDGGRAAIAAASIVRVAPASRKKDAAKIGGGAAGGAIIGGILGGGSGAAKGAAIGGGAGTVVVLSTRGQDVRIGAGTPLSVKLTGALTVRTPVR